MRYLYLPSKQKVTLSEKNSSSSHSSRLGLSEPGICKTGTPAAAASASAAAERDVHGGRDNLVRLVLDLAVGPLLRVVVLNERHAIGPLGGRCLGLSAHLGRVDRPTNRKRREDSVRPTHIGPTLGRRVHRVHVEASEVVDVDAECLIGPVDDCLGLDGHRVDGSSGSEAFFEGEVRLGRGVVRGHLRVRGLGLGHADLPGAVAQAEALAQHIEAATLQRVGGRHGQRLAVGLRDGGVTLRDAELQDVTSGPPTEATNG